MRTLIIQLPLDLPSPTLSYPHAVVQTEPDAKPLPMQWAAANLLPTADRQTEVLSASLPGLDLASARQAVGLRQRGHWPSLDAAREALGAAGRQLDEKQHSVQSRYFEVQGRMRIDNVVQQERALVRRDGNQVRMLWRVRNPTQRLITPLQ